MADVPAPKPVEGYARIRRLGEFNREADPILSPEEMIDALAAAARRRLAVQLVLALLGLGSVVSGVVVLWGIGWALLVFGMMSLALVILMDPGVMSGRNTNQKAGE